MMFSQSLSRDPASARAATQRFMAFLELEAERGQLSRSIEKKVLGESMFYPSYSIKIIPLSLTEF